MHGLGKGQPQALGDLSGAHKLAGLDPLCHALTLRSG
jgi:hypothetical protein